MITLDRVVAVILVVVCLVFLYMLILWLPVNLRDHSACLELGYPEVHTTFTLDSYCIGVTEVTKL
jgi:succinate dehydrogenase hydrophobic anchor subunit